MSLADLLNLLGNGIWIIGAAVGVYFGIRSDIRDLRKDISVIQRENDDTHKRHEGDMADHELRIRLLEKMVRE